MLIYYGPCNILDSSRPATSGKAICIISTNLEAAKTSHLQCIQTSKSKVQAIKINSSIQDFDLIFFFRFVLQVYFRPTQTTFCKNSSITNV